MRESCENTRKKGKKEMENFPLRIFIFSLRENIFFLKGNDSLS